MWIILAIGSAVFAGLASVLAKCGLHDMDSTVATAYRTFAVMIFICAAAVISGSYVELGSISDRSWVFLILSLYSQVSQIPLFPYIPSLFTVSECTGNP